MTDTATVEQPTTGTALAIIGVTTPAIFDDPNKVEDLLAKLERDVLAVPRDISTPGGREAIRSLAYKVSRSKTALDEMGKNCAADWKKKAEAVDVERRKIRERCDTLRDTVRKPLTDWEDAEAARVAAHEDALTRMVGLALFGYQPSSDVVRERIAKLEEVAQRDWQEFAQRAADGKRITLESLQLHLDKVEKAEAEAAELERLRAEKIERDRLEQERQQREREAAIAAEAAERSRLEAEAKAKRAAEEAAERAAAEQRRVEAERQAAIERADRADQERINAIAKAEEDRRLALEERARAAREHQEAISRAEADRERQAEEAEARAWQAAEQAERNRVAAIEAERKRVADERAAEEKATGERKADEEHRRKVNNKARDSLELFGVPKDRSKNVVTAIAKGEIPHVTIAY